MQIRIRPSAYADLLKHAGDLVRAKFLATIEQLNADQGRLEELKRNRSGEGEEFWTHIVGVRKIVQYKDDCPSRDVWRFKIRDLENMSLGFRFFYSYFPRARTFFVLAALPRDESTYDYTSEHAQRVIAEYDELCRKYD